MRSGGEVDRRSFLVGASAAGGGLALGLAIPLSRAGMRAAEDPSEINCWVSIAPDDTVIIRIAHAEMGQGAIDRRSPCWSPKSSNATGARSAPEFVSPGENSRRHRVWGDMSTGASRSISSSQHYLREAGADRARNADRRRGGALGRAGLANARAHNSVITHAASGRSVTFGEVAEDAAKIEPPANVTLKDPQGLEARRHAAPASRHRTTRSPGSRSMPSTCGCPDMLYAAIVHCPVFRGALQVGRRNCDRGHEGRAPHRAHAGCGRGGGR